MPKREYRTALYESYVSVQTPEWAAGNAQASEVRTAANLRRLRDWLPSDKNSKCLDLGCGSGRFLQALHSLGYSDVCGVDIGPQAVEIARKMGLQATLGDFRKYLRETHEYFDLITAFDVIEHFGKDEVLDLLQLVRSRLAPNGRFIIQTPTASSPWPSSSGWHDLSHEWIFDPHCMNSTLKLAGFGESYVREVDPYVHGFNSALRWFGWKLIWTACALWNLIETGNTQGGIYTRNMIVLTSAQRNPHC